MSDIVERLRADGTHLACDAALEIERLLAKVAEWTEVYNQCDKSRDAAMDEIERLRAALRTIADNNLDANVMASIAYAALEGKPQLPVQEAWGKRRPGE